MLEGSIILLFFICIGVIYIIVTWFRVVGEAMEVNAKERQHKKRQKKGKFTFERLDYVQGILSVDGKVMRTYNIGNLDLDKKIEIVFYDSPFSKEIRINDIYYLGNSIFSYAEKDNWRENTRYAITVLKSLVNNGQLESHLANEVDEIFQDVEDLNKYMKTGNLVRTEDEEFAWVF